MSSAFSKNVFSVENIAAGSLVSNNLGDCECCALCAASEAFMDVAGVAKLVNLMLGAVLQVALDCCDCDRVDIIALQEVQ